MTGRPAEIAPKMLRLIMELRRCGIVDARVLGALERIPREMFVPATFADQAYENTALPIGHGQTVSQPLVVARMTEALEVGARHKVLEIGTGSGYQAAVLAKLCRRLFSIERHRELLREAEQRLAKLRIHNVTLRFGDGTKGWAEQAPFDRIIVTAAAETVPEALVEQLAEDGVMILPLGPHNGNQRLVRLTKSAGGLKRDDLIDVRFVPLLPGQAREL
jgi:protein-L-isoaspartate(D-aspartate) O-methyltransferase